MEKVRLGKTNLMVSRSGFGAIPIQRISNDNSSYLLKKAFDNGINFFDTARSYTDSEYKIGLGLSSVRSQVIIATKTPSMDAQNMKLDLETSLNNLNTDYIDIYQFHNPPNLQDLLKSGGVYEAALEAKAKGMIRFIGITNHRLSVAIEAVDSGLFDTIQFPFNQLSNEKESQFVLHCRERDVGFIGMKALSGGLITNATSSFAFLRQYPSVVPIWGIQKEWELDEIIGFEKVPPQMDATMMEIIRKDIAELGGSFCRACGYCLPCPAGIPIPTAARISLLLKRTVYENFLKDDFKNQMNLIDKCIDCGHCKQHCPYELDTPRLLKEMHSAYKRFMAQHS